MFAQNECNITFMTLDAFIYVCLWSRHIFRTIHFQWPNLDFRYVFETHIKRIVRCDWTWTWIVSRQLTFGHPLHIASVQLQTTHAVNVLDLAYVIWHYVSIYSEIPYHKIHENSNIECMDAFECDMSSSGSLSPVRCHLSTYIDDHFHGNFPMFSHFIVH